MSAPRLLLADRSQTTRRLVARVVLRLLEQLAPGGTIEEADSGSRALATLLGQTFDVALVADDLGDMDAGQLLSTLGRSGRPITIPVLVLVPEAVLEQKAGALLDAGALDVLPQALAEAQRLRASLTAALRIVQGEHRLDELLGHFLPPRVLPEYRRSRTLAPKVHPDLVVMFLDIRGFTAFTRRSTAARSVLLLDRLYRRWDRLIDTAGIEKIKTIGDAYMAVQGLWDGAADVEATLACCLAMFAEAGAPDINWQAKAGIARGPAIIGLLSGRRSQFDLWGDTVNLAARLCSAAAPDQVLVFPPLPESPTVTLTPKGYDTIRASVVNAPPREEA